MSGNPAILAARSAAVLGRYAAAYGDALQRPCPICDAPRGALCVNARTGLPHRAGHVVRHKLARMAAADPSRMPPRPGRGT